jgi:hypothetical protein
VENTDIIQTFRRSRALTKGYRWQVLALTLMYIALLFVLDVTVHLAIGVPLIAPSAIADSPLVTVWFWAERVVAAPVGAVSVASTYFELKLVKEGNGAESFAQVFD